MQQDQTRKDIDDEGGSTTLEDEVCECEYIAGDLVAVHGKGSREREWRENKHVWKLLPETQWRSDGKTGEGGGCDKGGAQT
jgi:hypothetical protein